MYPVTNEGPEITGGWYSGIECAGRSEKKYCSWMVEWLKEHDMADFGQKVNRMVVELVGWTGEVPMSFVHARYNAGHMYIVENSLQSDESMYKLDVESLYCTAYLGAANTLKFGA